ncbi:MAG: hypothetical protein WBB85_12035 [Albidovulum sp.]|uniref:hypothetical protein n=1 Tax=Albidovulum sp. TaxID=1872424 RepID=UPI003C94F86D
MIDERAVAKKLAVLGGEKPIFRDGGRVISNGILPPPLTAVLDEIDNTVLKRRLTFRAGDSTLSFVVAGRRLMNLVSASPDLSMAQPLIGTALSHDDEDTFETVAAAIVALTEDERPILVESTHSEESGVHTNIGIPIDRMTELMGIDLADKTQPMQHFIDACEEYYSACLFWVGGIWIGQSEDEALLARLRVVADTQWDRFRDAYGKNGHSADTPRLIILDRALDEDGSVTAAWADGEYAIFAHDQSDAAEIHATWRRIFTF